MRHSDTWLEWFALIVKAAELEAQGAVVEALRLLAAAAKLRQELDDETPFRPVCPRCGDLSAPNATRCGSCGAPLILTRPTRATSVGSRAAS